MRRLATAIVMPCAMLTLAAACASTPESRFYTLSTSPPPAAMSSDVSVAVGPVSVPAVVDRPQIVVSLSPNRVWMDEFNRWASPLQNSISRAVAENLVAMLGTPNVTQSSQTLGGGATYRAIIDVQSFESVPGEMASLDAFWTVSRSRDGKSQTGRTTVREPATEKGYEALAAAHSRAVGRLSRAIADAVGALESGGK